MANICSIHFNIDFASPENMTAFLIDFKEKLKEADSKNEGVVLAKDLKLLFDAYVEESGDRNIMLGGSVKWALEHESIRTFTETYLKKMKVISFECNYEELGNLIYGKYTFDNGALSDYFLDESHPEWKKLNTDEDNYFDELEKALDNEGVEAEVA